jgi:hypothetical protein
MYLRRSFWTAEVGFPGEFFEVPAELSSGDFVLLLLPRHGVVSSSAAGKLEEGVQE